MDAVIGGWVSQGVMGLMIATLLVALVIVYTGKEKLHVKLDDMHIEQFKTNMAVAQAVESLTENLKVRTELEDRRSR